MTATENTSQTPELGQTIIEDAVIAKVAGIAARETPGVHALGGGVARALGAIREAVTGAGQAQGISVKADDGQVSVDVVLVTEYPTPLQEVADGVRQAIINAIETIVGMTVTEVNVTVNDVHLPSDDTATDDGARAQ
ncbi:Asp23/Gls24 family envelope stress response protein [Tessaracoccus sp. OH4464_COT-324]|uniref:Asp23/Gls24 family envelope stress response protein n=1 Tax=Tessaracoccus sp. OH4464_COT-324 TaxID=2491059 RepID=UPI000F62E564|nr:Asp23/Gls24 family envelope stress response protein [Tessaracoccus sp. OH4464_COT-324]RRD45730.1 Asp23/Gls24 family envelope stress response protein [Tessaracoccus sp. OH4464_COT-324]